jgi:hypothetical protein
MQGQQTVAANSVVGSSTNSTGINASATVVNTTGTSVTATTTSGNEKSVTPTNRSNNTPPPSGAAASATTNNINGPSGENDAMNSLDEQTATSGDSINKDRS